MADIQGSISGETLNGTENADTINGDAGDDTLNGLGGKDTLNGQADNDTLNGGADDDILRGGDGNDILNGEGGDDTLIGGLGNDLLIGGAGADRVSLYTEANGVTVDLRLDGVAQNFGALGTDTLSGIEHVNTTYWGDTVYGTDAGNVLITYAGNDTINSYGGDDFISVGYGHKIVDGGTGDDTVEIFDDALAPVYTSAGITVSLELQGQAQATGVGDWTLTSIENLSGFYGDDHFTGDGNANILAGADGNDTLIGGGGNDTLMGDGAMVFGTPLTQGGYAFFADLISIGFAIVEGNDSLYGGDGSDVLFGGGGNDHLEGGADDDILDGGTGADFMAGGVGNDIYYWDYNWDNTTADNVVELAGEGTDEVRTSVSLGIDWMTNVENLTAVGTGDLFLGGSAGANVITGNSGNNGLRGDGGNDTIDGGAGNDFAMFTLAAGTVGSIQWVEGSGADAGKLLVQLVNGADVQTWAKVTITAAGSATVEGIGLGAGFGTDIVVNTEQLHFFIDQTVDPANQHRTINLAPQHYGEFVAGGEGPDSINVGDYAGATNANGNAGNDTLIGNASNNYFQGGTGNDTIQGGGGRDTAAFNLPEGTVGSYRLVDGAGSSAGKLVVQRVDGATVEDVFLITVNGVGSATVEGINSAAFLGTDTVTGVEELHFLPVGPFDQNKFLAVNLAPYVPTSGFLHVTGGEASDFISLPALYPAEPSTTTINANGGRGDDTILGTEGGNFVNGDVGNDTISGNGGNDNLLGGAGNDTLNGGAGKDTLNGEGDNDTVSGGDGADTVRGGAGNDALNGDAGDDFLIGGAGDDVINGGLGLDRISLFDPSGAFGLTVDLRLTTAQNFGPFGNDTLSGIEHVNTTYGSDTVHGNDSANWIWTYSGLDTLYGYAGDDYFTVGRDNKVIDGGGGSDTVEIDDQDFAPLYGAGGITVSLALQGQAQATGTGNWTLTGIENLSGNIYTDRFTGDANANILAGAAGDDVLIGGGGDDQLMGDGAMFIGNDPENPNQFWFEAENASITPGNDTLSGEDGNDLLYGGGGTDTLDGGTGHDELRGGAGNDTLTGGTGDDFLSGGAGDDVVAGGDGIDRLSLFDDGTGGFGVTVDLRNETTAQDFGPLGNDLVSGIEHVNTTYNSDTVHGNDAANWMWTYDGTDTLFGYGGNDLFTVGQDDKIIDGGDGSDTVEMNDYAWEPQYTVAAGITVSLALQGQSQATGVGNWNLTNIENLAGWYGNDKLTGDEGANILAGGEGNDNLTGGGGNDTLAGDGAFLIGHIDSSPNAIGFVANPTTDLNYAWGDGNDTLNGGAGDDTLIGAGGNDTLYGGTDNDTLDGGTGTDKLYGEAGNDTLVVANALVATEVYDGGADSDTLELRSNGAAITYGFNQTTVAGIEQVSFASTAGSSVTGSFLVGQIATSGITQIVGGAGRDVLTLIAAAPGGTFTMPTLTLSNWTSSTHPSTPGDIVVLLGAGNGAFTLNARDDLGANQFLIGANGNDTLNGSNGTDLLNGGLGNNVLNGNGGDDVLILANNVNAQGIQLFQTGLGSTFDGGDGIDTLSIGGVVYFEGTLLNVEGFYLQPAVVSTSPNGAGGQAEAYLEMGVDKFPATFFVDGFGTIDPDLNSGDSFDFSGVVFNEGSNVSFLFDGESEGVPTEVTWVGTSHGDFFDFGADIVTVTGGSGADVFELDPGDDSPRDVTITDFTIGEDKVDLSETGITGGQRLLDFISQVGNDVVIAGSSGGQTFRFVLQNISLGDLSEDDFVFGGGGEPEIELTGTTFDDILMGLAGNDELHGGDGNDRIYTGGGTDLLFGDAGNDTLIVDELFTTGTFNGGIGSDTLELRTAAYKQSNEVGPVTGYGLIQSTLSGIETVKFASDADAGVSATMLLGQALGAGITGLVGGVGIDTLVLVATGPTGSSFTMPTFSLTGWQTTTTPWTVSGDAVVMVVGTAGNYTLNAREGLASTQVLVGGAGNDILNGSSGTEVLIGQAGSNVLNGNGGDDVLIVANAVNAQGVLTAYTGAGSSFSGGSGHDTLSIGGAVDFQGTLSGIERIYLQAAFTSAAPNGQGNQAAAVLSLAGDILASLPANLVLSGTGTVAIDLDPGDVYNASAWTTDGGAVAVHVTGSSADDTITLGSFAETVDDDGGLDTAVFAGNSTDYVVTAGAAGSINIGVDNLSGIELFKFADSTFFWNGTALVDAVTDGLVADGYVAGATVWIDFDNDGVLDENEPFTITDGNGDFTLVSPGTGPLRATGGVNLDTGRPNTVQFSAPEGATVINPLTTLVQAIFESSVAADPLADPAAALEAAQSAVLDAFNLDPSLDLATLDLIEAATADPALLSAQQAAASVAEVLAVVNNAGGDSQAALGTLGTLVTGGTVDLTNSSTLTTIVSSGITGDSPASATDIVAVVQASTQAISEATSVAGVSAAQQNQLPTLTADTDALSENGTASAATRALGVLGDDVDPDTGETVLLRVSKAQGTGAVTAVATSGQTAVQGAYGTLQIGADGTYSYTAGNAAAEALAGGAVVTDVFTYSVIDPAGETVTATLTFTVTGVDDAAVAVGDVASVAENATIAGASLFGNDSDVDGPALAVAQVNGSDAGVGAQVTLASGALLTVNANGTYSYDPNGKFNSLTAAGSGAANTSATDSFTYALTNGNTATVTITVNGVAGAGDTLAGNGGNNIVNGSGATDVFDLSQGGDDSVSGMDGDDGFYFGGALTAADNVDGGTGGNDQIGLQGDYSAQLVLGAGNLVNVEVLALLSGTFTQFGDPGTNFYDYNLKTVDANVAAGQRLTVTFNTLRAGEDVTFDGSAETDGYFLTYGGGGTDHLTGGQQNDGFYFGNGGQWGSSDTADGQAGTSDQLGLQGNYTLAFGAGQLSGVEAIVCLTGADVRFGSPLGQSYSYDLTMHDGNIAAGATMYVAANTLRADVNGLPDETLSFDGSAETNGKFIVYGGAGADAITGGASDDQLWGGAGYDVLTGGAGADVLIGGARGDTLNGGLGNDVFRYDNVTDSNSTERDGIQDFNAGDLIDLSRIDADDLSAGDQAFTFIGSAAFGNTAGELRYENISLGGPIWLVQGDTDGNGVSDFEVVLFISPADPITISDFIL